MSSRRFSSGSRFVWKDIGYQVVRLLPGNQINIEDISTGATLVVEMSRLVNALFDGELKFVVQGKHGKKDVKNSITVASKFVDLGDCPESWIAIARYRFSVISPLLSMEKRTLDAVKKRVKEIRANTTSADRNLKNSVSVASIYRWIKDYTDAGKDLRALIPATDRRGHKGKTRLPKHVESMIDSVIADKYYVREKITINDIRDELALRITEENQLRSEDQQLNMPSESTLKRRIRGLPSYKKVVAKNGARTAKRKFSQYRQTDYPTMPLERVEMDHTLSDLIVIDSRDNLPLGRLTLTYCLDMATRYPLGYYLGFEPPSYLSVMECLYHAIRPKADLREKYGTEHNWLAFGTPTVLMVDNAREFTGGDLEDACQSLGIILQQAPVRTPHFKAGIERNYRSLNTELFHKLPGTTFSNMQERGDYNSSEQACVYLDEVDKMLSTFIVDIYAQQFHRGVNAIPARRWQELTRDGFVPGLPYNAQDLSILLGRTTTRVIHHYGIEFACLRYNCDELIALRTTLKGRKAKIKYHPADLSSLYVYDPYENQYIQAPALDQDYTQGLSLWKHRVIRQEVLSEQDRVDIVALGRAKRKIQQIVDQGRKRKRQRTRSRIARWETAGKPTRTITQQVSIGNSSDELIKTNTLSKSDMRRVDWLGDIEIQPDSGWEIVYRKDIFSDKREGNNEQ